MNATPRRRARPADATPADRYTDRFDEIVTAAAELFRTKGYAATTTQDVAEAVGVLKGSLYHYITTKEDLLFAIVEDVYQAFSAAQAQREATDDPIEDIRSFIITHAAMNASRHTKSAVFYQEAGTFVGERRSIIREWRHNYEDRLKGLLTTAKDAGRLRMDVDAGFTARAVLGMVNSMHQWYRPNGRDRPDDVGRRYADLVLSGIVLASPGSRSRNRSQP